MRIKLGLACAALLSACSSGPATPASGPEAGSAESITLAASGATNPSIRGKAVIPAAPVTGIPAVAVPAEPLPAGAEQVTVTGSDLKVRRSSLADYLRALSDTSCPAGVKTESAQSIGISAKAVPLQPLNPSRTRIGELTFIAGYHLISPDKRFGGLSGLDILDNGNLLAVSDEGNFVWIDLAQDGLRPVAARIAPMHNAKGDELTGKADGDAEGLAVNAGMALVSFERNHRILAYDLGRCGAGARGAPIVFGGFGEPLPEAFRDADIKVDANEGVEPLGITNDWYLFSGIETKVTGDLSPLSARPIEAPPDFKLRVGVEMPPFVGLDVIPDSTKGNGAVRTFELHRSFNPLSGNGIVISETDLHRYLDQTNLPRRILGEVDERARYIYAETGWRKLAELNIFLTIDNFEGIAAKELPDGKVRLYIISDDNFSASQRTLLMIFDAPRPLRR